MVNGLRSRSMVMVMVTITDAPNSNRSSIVIAERCSQKSYSSKGCTDFRGWVARKVGADDGVDGRHTGALLVKRSY